MPDAPGLELIRGEIERDRPGAVLATSFDRAQPALIVDPAQILAVLSWLRDEPGQRYDAAGTEEWARGGPRSEPSPAAAEAYEAARELTLA